MQLIQRHGLMTALRRITGLRSFPFAGINETILPVVIGGDASRPPFDSGISFGMFLAKAAVAGNFAWVGLRNPAKSGLAVVIDYMVLTNYQAAATMVYARVSTQEDTANTTEPVVTKRLEVGGPAETIGPLLAVENATVAMPGSVACGWYLGASSQKEWKDCGIVMLPGTTVAITSGTVNFAVRGSIVGRAYNIES